MNYLRRTAIIAFLIFITAGTLHSQIDGEKVGEIKQVDQKTSEVIVCSLIAGNDIQMGDLLYMRIEGKIVQMRVTFPMQTIVKCKPEGQNQSLLNKVVKGMTVYRYRKGVENFEPAKNTKSKIYMIGDRGPAGGLIFYDKGSYADGWRYLEASPENLYGGNGLQWYNGSYIQTGASGTDVGTGKSNTLKIINAQGEGNYAAKICADYRGGGKKDWFLPSKDELNLMRINLYLKNVGGFRGGGYWSSSEDNADNAWLETMYGGDQINNSHKGNRGAIRAIRSF